MKEKSVTQHNEFKDIAEKLLTQYPRFFPEDFTLDVFYFIKTSDIKPKWVARVRKVGHPWNTLPGIGNIVYLVETAEEQWEKLSKEQRNLVVLHELLHIPFGGCDYESSMCGSLRDHSVQDFPEVIAAAKGNLFWATPGYEDIPDIINGGDVCDLEKALINSGLMPDPNRGIKEEALHTEEKDIVTIVKENLSDHE